MKITIITACFNSVATVRDALESVRRQKLPDEVSLEHLVIDGGSTDGTVEQIRAFAGQQAEDRARGYSFRWISERDRGLYDAINKGIRMATGEIIGILNADDLLDGDDVLARVASAWGDRREKGKGKSEKGKGKGEREKGEGKGKSEKGIGKNEKGEGGVDCLYGNVRFVDSPRTSQLSNPSASRLRTTRVCFARFWRPWMLQWGYMPPHPAIFIRRACFEKWGMYVPERTEYRIAADYELLIRFFRVNRMRARYMPVCTTQMRPGGLSTKDVEARKKLNEEIVKGNRVNGYFCVWPMLLPKYAIKIWEFILPRLGLCR